MPAVAQRGPADPEAVHVARAGSRGDADLHQPARFLGALGGRTAQPEHDAVPDRALVDALLGLEDPLAEVEVDGTGQRGDAGRAGQGHHVGRDGGLGAPGERGGEVAHPRLGGIAERDVVLGGGAPTGAPMRLGAVRTRLDRQQQPHADEGKPNRENSARNMTVGG